MKRWGMWEGLSVVLLIYIYLIYIYMKIKIIYNVLYCIVHHN